MCHDREKLYGSADWVHPQINYKEKRDGAGTYRLKESCSIFFNKHTHFFLTAKL